MQVIPSGGYLVPEIKVGTGPDAFILCDSEKILHWFDENYPQAQFYPKELASELSVRASDKKLAGFVWYYNWVDAQGFGRSIAEAGRKVSPWYLKPLLSNFLLGMALGSSKTKFRIQASKAIGVQDDKDLDDEPKMRQMLIDELTVFQSHLQTTPDQPYLVPGTTQPTAADFSVYAQLERLVGGNGAYDVDLPPALPQLKEVASLQPLWAWHERMRQECPVQFKGKSPPKELLA